MPVLNTTCNILTGIGVPIAIDGAEIADAFFTDGCDSRHWFKDDTIIVQKNTTVSELWTYDINTTTKTKVDTQGCSRLGAGNSIWVASLVDATRTNVGGFGPLNGEAVGDVSEAGLTVTNTSYDTGSGVSIYDTDGSSLYSDPGVLLNPNFPLPFRNGVFMYAEDGYGWKLKQSDGTRLSMAHKAQWPGFAGTGPPTPYWVMPVVMADTSIWIVEAYGNPNTLTIRKKDSTSGFIVAYNVDTFNPDARETAAAGTIRICWCTSAGELSTSLQAMDLNTATGENITYIVDSGTLVGTNNPPLPLTPGLALGEYTGTRWFRTRWIEKNAEGQILRRSEPSEETKFRPSPASAGAVIARQALANEGETHWEVEASSDGADFFRIATVPIGTATYTDTTNLEIEQYADLGPASESIGTYLLQRSVRFLAADADRLLMGGHWTDAALKSRVAWTPVFADPGVGNDERLPLATGGDNFVDLDNYDGGGLTGISQMANGTWFAFKWHAIYKMSRTGDITHAYDPICVSKTRGALPDSIVGGVDENGRPCLYFLDPAVGPCMVGAGGIRDILGLRNTWNTITTMPEGVTCRAVFYQAKQQVHWWIPVNGASRPTLKLVLQVNAMQGASGNAVQGSWALANGLLATATAAAMWHETTVEDGVERPRYRPFAGLAQDDDVESTELIQRCDALDDDNGVDYHSVILSGAYAIVGVLNQWGTMASAFVASASDTISLLFSHIRNLGTETNSSTRDLSPEASEPYVIKTIDDIDMSEAKTVQFQVEDVD